jgi:hypothetical protein
MTSSYDCVCCQYNIIIKTNQDVTLPEYRCALLPGVMEPTSLLRKELIRSTYYLSRGSKNSGSKVIQLKMPDQKLKHKSMLPLTDLQSILKFRYAMFEMLRRKFPCPEQTSNGVSGK